MATRRAANLSCALLLAMLALCSMGRANEPARPTFALTTSDGQRITEASYPEQWKIIFFGFTHCPDVCPMTLLTLKQALHELGTEASQVRPLFVTVDPARDTREVLSNYLAHFGEHFTAATGSVQELIAAAGAFRAPFYRHDGRDGNYQMSHSSLLYVLDPSGALVATIRNGIGPKRLARELKDLMAQTWMDSSGAAVRESDSAGKRRSAVSFKSASGEAVDLAKFHGRVLLVQVWASWCVPCASSLRSLDRSRARFGGKGLEIIVTAADRSVEPIRAALDEASMKALQPYFGLTSAALSEWDVASLPTTMLIDKEGKEVARLKGHVSLDNPTHLAPVRRVLEAHDSLSLESEP